MTACFIISWRGELIISSITCLKFYTFQPLNNIHVMVERVDLIDLRHYSTALSIARKPPIILCPTFLSLFSLSLFFFKDLMHSYNQTTLLYSSPFIFFFFFLIKITFTPSYSIFVEFPNPFILMREIILYI